MKTITFVSAKITDNKRSLKKAADSVNNGRTDSTYFYVNGNDITVSNPYRAMSISEQLEELKWFLKSRNYEFLYK